MRKHTPDYYLGEFYTETLWDYFFEKIVNHEDPSRLGKFLDAAELCTTETIESAFYKFGVQVQLDAD